MTGGIAYAGLDERTLFVAAFAIELGAGAERRDRCRRPGPAARRSQRRGTGRRASPASAAGPAAVADATAAGRPAGATAARAAGYRRLAAPTGPAAGQDSTPFTGAPPFHPPTFNPLNGSMVGVAKPIMINFQVPIADQAMAERAIHISSIPPVPGKFYWMSPTQLRWRPLEFWPANTTVNIDAAGTSRASGPVTRWWPRPTTPRIR